MCNNQDSFLKCEREKKEILPPPPHTHTSGIQQDRTLHLSYKRLWRWGAEAWWSHSIRGPFSPSLLPPSGSRWFSKHSHQLSFLHSSQEDSGKINFSFRDTFLKVYPIEQNLVLWLQLTAMEAGKYSLYILGSQGKNWRFYY